MVEQPVRLNDELVAIATVDGGVLVGRFAELDPTDPARRFVTVMLRYALASLRGELQEDYADSRAELFARTHLMPDTDFDGRCLETDDELAARFGVPVAQVVEKHGDLVTWWDRPPALRSILV